MYAQAGLGQITFDDLRRAARRSRGFGQAIVSAPPTGIAPGSPCYDPSHDNTYNHCASISSTINNGILGFFGGGTNMTTTCSQAEQSCLQGGAAANPDIIGALTPAQQSYTAPAPTPDPCSQTIGVSCGWLVGGAILLMIAVPLLTAARRF